MLQASIPFQAVLRLLLLLYAFLSPATCHGGDWEPAEPLPKQYDWVELVSGEWLRGEIIVLYNGKLEFDSSELKILSLDFEDVAQIRSSQVLQVRVVGADDQVGRVWMQDGELRVVGTGQSFPQEQILTITAGEPREINFWNFKVTVGANWRSGNTEQSEANAQAKAQRRTLEGRFVFDYLGNYNTTDGTTSANNHRASAVLDRFISHQFFVRPVFAEYYRDPFQNTDSRVTVGTGAGYQLVDTLKTEWDVFAGPAYQNTRFVEVEEGEPDSESTLALVAGTGLDIELTSALDFNYEYQVQFVSRTAGLYIHHMITGFSVELTSLLDFDISLVWDRIQEPQPDAEGNVPEQDDWRLILGLGFDF